MICDKTTVERRDASGETLDMNLRDDAASRSFAAEFLACLNRNDIGTGSTASDPIRVLDVGTGTARIPITICQRQGGIACTAVDRAARALETARRNVLQAGLSRAIHIVQAEAASLPCESASFDAVISGSLLHHVSNRLGVLQEMQRVLRPGGLLFIRDTIRGSDAGQIARILSRGSGSSPGTQQIGFTRTVHAMLSVDEARRLALAAGLPAKCVRQAGPRHWVLEFKLNRELADVVV